MLNLPAPLAAPRTSPRPLQMARFKRDEALAEPLFRDWLVPWRDALFRWTLSWAADADARRGQAEVAVAIQRLRGPAELMTWLYGAALQTAAQQAPQGGLAEATLTGLAPELRAVLRLVSRGEMRLEAAMALLAQRLGCVRSQLLRARLRG